MSLARVHPSIRPIRINQNRFGSSFFGWTITSWVFGNVRTNNRKWLFEFFFVLMFLFSASFLHSSELPIQRALSFSVSLRDFARSPITKLFGPFLHGRNLAQHNCRQFSRRCKVRQPPLSSRQWYIHNRLDRIFICIPIQVFPPTRLLECMSATKANHITLMLLPPVVSINVISISWNMAIYSSREVRNAVLVEVKGTKDRNTLHKTNFPRSFDDLTDSWSNSPNNFVARRHGSHSPPFETTPTFP